MMDRPVKKYLYQEKKKSNLELEGFTWLPNAIQKYINLTPAKERILPVDDGRDHH